MSNFKIVMASLVLGLVSLSACRSTNLSSPEASNDGSDLQSKRKIPSSGIVITDEGEYNAANSDLGAAGIVLGQLKSVSEVLSSFKSQVDILDIVLNHPKISQAFKRHQSGLKTGVFSYFYGAASQGNCTSQKCSILLGSAEVDFSAADPVNNHVNDLVWDVSLNGSSGSIKSTKLSADKTKYNQKLSTLKANGFIILGYIAFDTTLTSLHDQLTRLGRAVNAPIFASKMDALKGEVGDVGVANFIGIATSSTCQGEYLCTNLFDMVPLKDVSSPAATHYMVRAIIDVMDPTSAKSTVNIYKK